tara:strand:- start:15190 stop:15807 length:618 start_codon:yes stop_codon:yes gene_type:complete
MIKLLKTFIFIYLLALTSNLANSNENSLLDIKADDFVIGDKNAPVTIIEYASMSCSHCANFHVNKLDTIKKEYIDTGKVQFVFRDFPFNFPALLGSMIMRCTPNDVRYEYMNALYKLRKSWVLRENAKSKEELYKIMQSGGMTKEEFEACISNTELENKILQGIIDAQKEFNISTTPSFIINGNLIQGDKSLKEFRQIIDKILSE